MVLPSLMKRLPGPIQRRWTSSQGVQAWMRDALRRTLAQLAREVAQGLDPRAENAAPASHPRTVEGVRVTIRHLQETLQRLDDVQDFPTIGDIDDDMYRLWKELEKKMQMHRQSEAKFQLKDMFRI